MYRHCIYCSASFGSNAAVEAFPVGSHLAFDAWRGRLWAICPMCTRWNLAPLEERWEAVEEAERTFRDARLRVQSENVGLARLPDGTRLVRIGEAMPGELAAWRYGGQLLRRRTRHIALTGAGILAGFAAVGGMYAMGTGVAGTSAWLYLDRKLNQRIVHKVVGGSRENGKDLIIRRWHIPGIRLLASADPYDLHMEIRDAHRESPAASGLNQWSRDIAVLGGDAARAVLARAMIRVNKRGASREMLLEADRILSEAGSAHRVLHEAGAGGAALGDKAGKGPPVLKGPGALALEMALHEEQERRALEGELSILESAWKEAEEIAAIADSLPGEDTVTRLLDRLRL